MSVVYPQDPGNLPPPSPPSPGSQIVTQVENHPLVAGVLVLALALAIGYVIHKIFSASSSSTNTSDANGPQTLYVPTSNTFETINTISGSQNTTTSTVNNPPSSPPTGTSPPIPASDVFYTTKTGDTIDTIYQQAKKLDPQHYWGEDRIALDNQALAGFSRTAKLPAGLKVQVGGVVPSAGPGIGSGGFAQIRPRGGVSGWDDAKDGVPLHASPDRSSPIVGVAAFGSHVPLVAADPQAGWYAADMGGAQTYLHTMDVVGMSV